MNILKRGKYFNTTIPKKKEPTNLTMEKALILIEKKKKYEKSKKSKKKRK